MTARIAACACALAIMAGCSNDTTISHEPVRYNVYAGGSDYAHSENSSSTVYVYDADSLRLLDSLAFPHVANDAVASPDGQSLFIEFWPYHVPGVSHYLARYDIASRSITWKRDVDAGGRPRLFDDGKLLLYGREVMDPASGDLLRRLDEPPLDDYWVVDGPMSGTEVAAIVRDTVPRRGFDSAVVALDISSGLRHGWFVPRLHSTGDPLTIRNARIHPDGRRTLCVCIAGNTQDAWFIVGDLTSGEQVFSVRISTPFTEIAISDDGSLAVVADRGNAAFGYGWPAIYIIDLDPYSLMGEFDGRHGIAYWPGRIRFLPGDRRVALMPDNTLWGRGWLQSFDLNSLTPDFVVDTPWFEPIVCAFTVGPRSTE